MISVRYEVVVSLLAAGVLWACDVASSARSGRGDSEDTALEPDGAGAADASVDAGDAGAADGVPDATTADAVADTGGSGPVTRGLAARACIDDAACLRPIVVAHRAFHASAPENSLAAVRAAAAAAIPFVEVDVQLSADGVPVVMHDGSVDRTTNGTGAVSALRLDELRELELVGGSPDDPETQRVPTFAEVLSLAVTLDLAIYLDLKTAEWAPVVDAIRAADAFDRVLMRDDVDRLIAMQDAAPELWMLAPVRDAAEASEALAALPGLTVAELVAPAAQPATTAAIRALGLKVQQDVIAAGDLVFDAGGGGAGWQTFIEAGVQVLQSDRPADLAAHLSP